MVEGNDRYCPKANRPFAVIEALSPASVRAISTYSSLSRVSSQSLTSFKAIRVVRAICESWTKLSISAEASRIACKTIRWAPISLAMTCLDSGRSSRRNCRASMLGQNPEWRWYFALLRYNLHRKVRQRGGVGDHSFKVRPPHCLLIASIIWLIDPALKGSLPVRSW